MIINLPENHYKALKYLRQLIFFKLFELILNLSTASDTLLQRGCKV
jgi:hypothetical protein